jgi:thiol-disulfide isomerase/thioredoxin
MTLHRALEVIALVEQDAECQTALVSAIRPARIRAPELVGGGGWLNTGGAALSLGDLRGKIVLLDFWTFCCINCLHVIDELRPLEAKYGAGSDSVAVLIGVHSPKFVHETDHAAVAAAVERYGIEHPVLDDPALVTWDAYTARAWPTLVVIDPEGYVAAHLSGEGHRPGLETLIDELVAEHDAKGTLRRGDSPFVPPVVEHTTLRFPGKALRLPSGRFGGASSLLVSDSGHHRLVVLEADLETVRRSIGDRRRGLLDGPRATARFNEPQGLCLLPAKVARAVGYDIVVADTVNHTLRGVRLDDLSVRTIAGTGAQRMTALAAGTTAARTTELSSPWDVEWLAAKQLVVVAMAGTHQLAAFDPLAATVALFAGTGHEGLVDGEPAAAWFAQSSGLAVSGEVLWVADSETSALRRVDGDGARTAIGKGLFTFGHRDGAADQALLQHPLGVAVLPDESVLICDTYNGALRHFDPRTSTVSTMATGLAEPSDAVVFGEHLVVVESAAHRLTAVGVAKRYLDIEPSTYQPTRTPVAVAPGRFELTVAFTPPVGQHFDERDGPATRMTVEVSPPGLLVEGSGSGVRLDRTVTFGSALTDGVLHVTCRVATCDDGDEHAACRLHQQDWGIPVTVTASGASRLELMLRGLPGSPPSVVG